MADTLEWTVEQAAPSVDCVGRRGRAQIPLVLVHNEVKSNPDHDWDDKEGVHYHYPSKYRGKIITGEPFVYYRGVHRKDGKRRPQGEYFGAGRVGKIWADPTRARAWYCAIDDYQPFPKLVLAKVDGVPREDIPSNLWRDGVRPLNEDVYRQILAEAGMVGLQPIAPPIAQAASLVPQAADDLIVPPKLAAQSAGKTGFRKSKRAKAIGDWAETAALNYIQANVAGCSDCVHRAAIGETPGWDLDYVDAAGVLQRVEVKGTVAAAFTGVDMTAGELRAARAHGDAYWLYLVAGCETAEPRVQIIQNPAAKLAAGDWTARPTIFAVRFAP